METLQRDLIQALKAQADSAAKTSTVIAGGGLTPSRSPEIAHELAEMQRKYLENLNFDAVEIACMSALDRAPAAPELARTLAAYLSAVASTVPEPEKSKAIQQASIELFGSARASGFTGLGAYCFTNVLPTIQTQKAALWGKVLDRANAQSLRANDTRTLNSAANEVEQYNATIRRLLESYKSLLEIKPATGASPPVQPSTGSR